MVTPPPDGQEYTIFDVFHVIWRRKLLVATLTVAITTMTMALVTSLQPVYTAQAQLLIEPQRALTDSEFGQPIESADKTTVASQVEILRSRSMASEVINSLGLDAAALETIGIEARLKSWAMQTVNFLIGEAPAFDQALTPKRHTVDTLLDQLKVVREGDSNVVSVSVSLGDPDEAARVANAIADRYLVDQLASKRNAARRASSWLDGKLVALGAELDAAEARLAALADTTGDAELAAGLVDNFELANIRQELVEAGIDRQALASRFERVQELFRTGQMQRATDTLGSSTLLQNLQALKAELLRREAELSSRFGERHPQILAIQAEKTELAARIKEEQSALLEEYQARLTIAEAKEEQLQSELDDLKAATAAQSRRALQRAELTRDVELKRDLFQRYVAQLEGFTDNDAVHTPDARIISQAVPPELPSSPKVKLAFAMSSMLAMFLALIFVYFLERLDRGFRTGREVEQRLGLGVLMLVPSLPRSRKRSLAPPDVVLQHPRSRYAEVLRHGLAALLAGDSGETARVLLLTSTSPGEGKSNLSLSLGRLAAKEGRRVLVIDGDLRRPVLADRLELDGQLGLSDLLLGRVGIEEALCNDPNSPMKVLTGGLAPEDAFGLGSSLKFNQIIAWARQRFDLVLIDSPPLSAVADAKLYAAQADILLYIIQWHHTRQSLVERTLIDLRRLEPPPAAAILNKVDLREHARWARHETGFGYPELRAYYSD
ncbi:MAG: Wzz/FepE/Etk N-terminal domain-containing protein [Pseudomonadota bacterium]